MLIISNDEMKDSTKTLKSLKDSGLLLKGVSETIQTEVKKQKGGFLGMLLRTLGASLLGNILTSKGIMKTVYGLKNYNLKLKLNIFQKKLKSLLKD